MPQRLAFILSLLAFAVCLIIGGVETGNAFTTTVTNALMAMACTFVVGFVVGMMGQKMIDDSLKQTPKESGEPTDSQQKKVGINR